MASTNTSNQPSKPSNSLQSLYKSLQAMQNRWLEEFKVQEANWRECDNADLEFLDAVITTLWKTQIQNRRSFRLRLSGSASSWSLVTGRSIRFSYTSRVSRASARAAVKNQGAHLRCNRWTK